MEQPTQNIWARYGFNDNPFDTKALSITNNLPIEKAYIERENYKSIGGIMDYFLEIPGGGRIIVEGDSGVGKTTFVNYHKYKWQIIQVQNRLFSPETEISVQKSWRLEDFIINALGSLVGQLKLEIGEKKFNNSMLVANTSKSKQHINKFIQKFLDLELIVFLEKIGRSTYYELGPRLNLLSYLMNQK